MVPTPGDRARWDATSGVSVAYIAGLLGPRVTRDLLTAFVDAAQPVVATDCKRPVGYLTAWKMLNASVEKSGDESHALLGAGVPKGNFELLVASMLQGENLLDGLRRMAAGAKILRPDLSVLVSTHFGQPHLSIDFVSGPDVAKETYLEALMIVVHCAVRWSLGRVVQPVRIRGSAMIEEASGSLLALLGCGIRREGAGVTLIYDAGDAGAPFQARSFARWHDATYLEYVKLVDALSAEASAHRPGHDALVRGVRHYLLEGGASQSVAAGRMGMSVATLRRRLADRGVSFRGLLASVRRDTAEVLLLGDKSVDDIATELGLSDSRCFRRACRTWFGATPSQVRRSFRADRRPLVAEVSDLVRA